MKVSYYLFLCLVFSLSPGLLIGQDKFEMTVSKDGKGDQDTLYTGGLNNRQYFKDCYIQGTTDFIFSSAMVLFDDCIICSNADSYITAASTVKGKDMVMFS